MQGLEKGRVYRVSNVRVSREAAMIEGRVRGFPLQTLSTWDSSELLHVTYAIYSNSYIRYIKIAIFMCHPEMNQQLFS